MHIVILLLSLLTGVAHAFHAEVNPLQSPLTGQQSLRQLYFFVTPADMTLDDLLADPVHHHSFSLITRQQSLLFEEDQAVWLFARLHNSGNRPLHSILEYDFPLADKIEMYQLQQQSKDIKLLTRSGNSYPYSERALPYRSFAVSLTLLPDEETDIYIKIQDAAVIPGDIRLWRHDHFVATMQQNAILDGLLQGILLLLALYNLVLFIHSKARHYLYFTGFFVSFALVVAILNGMAFAVLWPEYPEVNQAILYIAVGAALLCLNLFTSHALQSYASHWWRRCSHISSFAALLLLFSPLFADGQLRLYLLFFALCWVLISNFLLALSFSLAGDARARTFVWACVLTLCSALLLTLHQAGYLRADVNWLYILFSLVLLCLALTSFNLQNIRLPNEPALQHSASMQQYHDIFHNAVEGMFTTTADGRLINVNQALLDILGYPDRNALEQAISGTGMARFYADPGERLHMLRQLELGSKNSFEIRGLRADNSPFWALMSVRLARSDNGKEEFVHGSVIDITGQKLAHEQLAYLANHDSLTALYNRFYFEQQLQMLCDTPGRNKGAVLYIDIDQFKVINNSCSHSAGDALLKQVSELFKRTAGLAGQLARLDSDEFGILLPGKNANEAFALGYRILDAMREFRFIWQDNIYPVSASIGIADIAADDSLADSVLKKADAACGIAKNKGRNRIQLFDEDDKDTQQHQAEVQWVSQLRQAIKDDKFVLHQQSVQALNKTSNGLHYELLLRLQGDENHLIAPAGFLSSADRYGLMPQIDRWVIRHYFRWLKQHPEHLQQLALCSINVSGSSLLDPAFKDDVQQLFSGFQIPYQQICFEITESAALVNLQNTLAFIEHFRALGCRIALDDFGSGFSSYSYLKHFPADFVKIDGHFVRDVLDDHYDKAIVKSIHEVAGAMGMLTIAVCVESAETLAALEIMGIDYAQGYAIARPMPLNTLLT
ncbi:EAL domain-containing protein [Rheinheimera sp.]|uniref:EAL domain-containing protein n=1 Tax=Rheinheimera sp. TaxID=1869214 RepID=UPI0027327B4F|nr:EAL domain-containing protein [Rheinheimera sp.]MDP2714739.1 EAL domain-containing protein [Rheinheimera sp.]